MKSRREMRSEETRNAILTAAEKLFSERGYDAVTMREIAAAARCSHTTIYIYFKDKKALLHELSMEPLQSLREKLEAVMSEAGLSPEDRLFRMSNIFIHFCLKNRNMYMIFFMAEASRVDEEQPAMEIQRLRNRLFGLLKQAVSQYIGLRPDQADLEMMYGRIYFFTLHGIIGTYVHSKESYEQLMKRLKPTFDQALRVLHTGMKQTVPVGGE